MSTEVSMGIKVYVDTVAPATWDQAGFAALTTKKLIGKLLNIPEFGATIEVIKSKYLEDNFVTKDLGSIDYGQIMLECSRDMTSEGQVICKDAIDVNGATYNKDHYFFIQLLSGELLGFAAKIAGAPINIGSADAVIGRKIPVEINSVVYEIEAP